MKEVKLYQKDNNLYKDKECTHLICGDLGETYEQVQGNIAEATLQLIKQGVSVDDIIKLKNQELL